MDKLVVKGAEISVQWNSERDDFISLTDIAKLKDSDNPRYIIQNWLRNRNTIEFLGVWESLYNPSFNRVEFDAFRSQAERLANPNAIAISQMEILIQDHRIEALEAHSGELSPRD